LFGLFGDDGVKQTLSWKDVFIHTAPILKWAWSSYFGTIQTFQSPIAEIPLKTLKFVPQGGGGISIGKEK
jgi:hypothetical protein